MPALEASLLAGLAAPAAPDSAPFPSPSSVTPPFAPPPRPDDAPHLRLLTALGRAAQQLDPSRNRRIFVNRTLRMEKIDTIGFDMDYTLALYNQPRMEALSVACTLKKMVDSRGYPQEILALQYDPSFAIRGLVIDRQNGNVLKMDRYGYVGRCYHGGQLLDREQRRLLYREQRIRLSHPRYAWIDTLFALPEAVIFARLVELIDRDHVQAQTSTRGPSPGGTPLSNAALDEVARATASPAADLAQRYDKLWVDIRESIDEAHRDESIKRVIKADVGAYLIKDPDLAPTLHRFRSAGRRLFLLTNSGLDYTDPVMSYLLDGELPNYPTWRSYFDAIVVDARKPAFFTERRPLIELDPEGRARGEVPAGTALQRGRIYQGGNVVDFHTQIGASGDRVLYVGDHIYGDMLRAKKSSVWRTAMIIQELEEELVLQARAESRLQQLEVLERRRTRIDTELSYQQMLYRRLARAGAAAPNGRPTSGPLPTPVPGKAIPDPLSAMTADVTADLSAVVTPEVIAAAILELRHRLEGLRGAYRATTSEIETLEQEIEGTFNPYWGPLFKAGTENSRFGEQVEDYACLYTSRVSNFLSYSPLHYFRSPRDHLPHERVY